jgi:hypothetical protein
MARQSHAVLHSIYLPERRPKWMMALHHRHLAEIEEGRLSLSFERSVLAVGG